MLDLTERLNNSKEKLTEKVTFEKMLVEEERVGLGNHFWISRLCVCAKSLQLCLDSL